MGAAACNATPGLPAARACPAQRGQTSRPPPCPPAWQRCLHPWPWPRACGKAQHECGGYGAHMLADSQAGPLAARPHAQRLPEVVLGHAAACNGTCFDKVLEAHVIDALGRQDHVGACDRVCNRVLVVQPGTHGLSPLALSRSTRTRVNDLLNALARDVRLTLANLLQLAGVAHQHLGA